MPTNLLTDAELLDIDATQEIAIAAREICGKWGQAPHESKDCKAKLHPYTMMLGLRRAVAKAQLAMMGEMEERDAKMP